VLSKTLSYLFYELLPWAKLINIYGSSEVSADVTYYPVAPVVQQNFILSFLENYAASIIGSPISNTKAYVLSSDLVPLPIGGIGELYIGGVGLARGYLNLPALTEEKFIINPFQSTEEKEDKSYGVAGRNARLYRTGDLVRWLPDGNIEYIGRNDFQVKIRGYRIELGEIESRLSSYEGVKQSVVLAKEHNGTGVTGGKYLVGYYVSDNKLAEEEILNYLQSKLPEYMVPSILIHLEELPLTINGKLDRKALPDPELTDERNYVAPRNEVEKKICQIWAEVLGLEESKIGIRDDFFRLGGNSILVIKLMHKINKVLQMHIDIQAIFKQKTICNLLYHLTHNIKNSLPVEEGEVL
jgi:acyl-coenzyme A synthetase/AMP-(fatty) acid ligase